MEGIITKRCFKCGNILSIDNFYIHPQLSDGHLNKCKTCTKNDVKKREKELRNDPEWIERERERGREKYYRLNYKGRNKPSREQKRKTMLTYQQKFPEKYMATKYTEIFLTKINGRNLHHWSYNQEDWLDIIELTIKDHKFFHRYLIYDQEFMMHRTKNGELLDSKEKHLEYLHQLQELYGN